ncbi:MAG: sugar phosphate nucleotidyltransferase [Bacteroidota bacterium]|nr:sugar phosphate nucleotidyltransferase [Bacteroidota bacterium]
MKAVILAGGLGTRLRPFTEIIPKPLLPIGEKAVMEIQIENLKRYGFDEIFLATNYKSKYIENFFGDGSKYGINLHISKEDIPLGTAGPVTLLKDYLKEPFLVMNGDILTLMDFRKFYDFAINVESSLVIGIKEILTPFRFGQIFTDGDYVTGIEEKPDFKSNILAGIYIFKPDIFKFIPEGISFGMDKLILKMLESNAKIAKYDIKEYWLDIGKIDDYEKAQNIYNEHFKNSI